MYAFYLFIYCDDVNHFNYENQQVRYAQTIAITHKNRICYDFQLNYTLKEKNIEFFKII